MDGLKDAISTLGGDPKTMLVGWSCVIIRRQKGLNNGLLETIYIHEINENETKRFRFRLEVGIHLGLAQPKYTTKSLPIHEMHMMANEFREKYLVSQLVEAHGNRKYDIVRDKDDIRIVNPSGQVDETLNDVKFSLGNITVLSWGKIIPTAGFHTVNQIFPLGFKCIRQEHDTLLNKIVDCYCEIDSITDAVNVDGKVSENVVPLFRVTLAWQLDSGKRAIRVYEGRSAPQAWQSAMLETLGQQEHHMKDVENGPNFLLISLDEAKKANEEAEGDAEFSMEVEQDLEEFDEEEESLRNEIRDQRRGYFRALRHEQSLGLHAAVKPRLLLDSVENFADEAIMRLIEGMEGADRCVNYQFTDARDKDTRRRLFICKSFNRLFTKAKSLDKVIMKDAPSRKKAKAKVGVMKRAPGGGRKPAGVPRVRVNKVDLMTKHQQDQFEASIEQRNQTRKKIKDVEKKIKELKDNIKNIIKKRRDEAKLRVEINCAKEEQARKRVEMVLEASPSNAQAVTLLDRESKARLMDLQIPEPSSGFMCLDGEVFSKIVELWNFLQTFANILCFEHPPKPERLINDIKCVDNDYKILYAGKRLSTMGLCDFIENESTPMNVSESLDYLNEIGVLLCTPLEKDFKKCIGLDQLDIPKDESDVPINRFTWKEICRILLLSAACKDLGMTDADLCTFIKGGRGNTLAPEGMDIKTVRILRRRINFHTEVLREENQESLYGFNAGLCVRIPCPGPYRDRNISSTTWKQFLASVAHIPDDKAWMVYQIIDSVITICKCTDDQFVQDMANKLDACIKAPIFSISNGSLSKKEALQLLESFQIEESNAENSDKDGMEVEPTIEKIETIAFLNSTEVKLDSVPLSPFSLWKLQKDAQIRHASGMESNDSDFVELDEDIEKDDEDIENQRSHSSPTALKELQLSNAANEEDEFARATLLSLASQRCYLVIRDLMLNPIAYSFCNPVRKQDAPSYSKTIANRLCFADIKRHLLNGGYENAISKFYTDVNLVFENALAFNPDFTQITHYAHKLLSIFERMFMEFVLYVDSPLPCMDACHICRSMDEPVLLQTGGAKCERCEGLFHLHCLTPPLVANPRQEWYCPFCIEQKGVATVHPNNTAKVLHPERPGLCGEVVGMEQIKQTIRFVIEFGTCREMWSGSKVRKNYASSSDSSAAAVDTSKNVTNRRDGVVPELPQGYNYDDYDAVCGLARGYQAWGASHHMVPSYISPQFSLEASDRKKVDPFFESCCDAVAALGHLVDHTELGSQEWSTILNATMKRALTSSHFGEELSKLEVEIGPARDASFMTLQSGSHVDYDTLIRKPTKYIPKEINEDEYDSDEEGPEVSHRAKSRGRPKKKDPILFMNTAPKKKPVIKPVEEVNEDEENKVNNEDVSTESESIASANDETDDDFENEVQEVKPVANTFAQWDNRLLSRKRGREDALMVQHSILDVFKDPDFIEEINKDKMSPIFDSVVKACAVRPADGLDNTDWCSAWGRKMDHFSTNILEEMKSPLLCQFCGYDEHYIAHPFVMAHTWAEWDADRNDSKVAEENKIWLPYDPIDAEIEKSECALQTRRALRPGSCVAHEMCADHMNYMRTVLYDRHGLHDYRDQIEVIVGVGRAKSTPVGTDRHGRLYWLLTGLPGIFVSANEKAAKNKSYSDNFAKGADKFLQPAQSKSVIWRIYNCEYEIAKLARWLDNIFPEERQLKKVIDWLFPNCLNAVAGNASQRFISNASSPAGSDEKVKVIDDDDNDDDDNDDSDNNRNTTRIRKRIIESDDEEDTNNKNDDVDFMNTEDDEEEEWDDEPKSKRSCLEKERTSIRCEILRLKKETEPQDDNDGIAKYRPDQRIIVETKQNQLLWEARILEVKVIDNDKHLYKVRFDKWGPAYDRWISEESIKSNRQAPLEGKGRSRQKISRDTYAEEHTDNIPECLSSLRAVEYLEAEYRESIRENLKLSFSDTTTDIDYMRYALLILEAALPCGSLEVSDDKWGEDFAISWREAVIAASDATALMGCLIMLEYCIKGTWTTTVGNKVLACLPTRTQALKTATVSQLALRLWLIDSALRYDKYITPEEKLNKSKKKSSKK